MFMDQETKQELDKIQELLAEISIDMKTVGRAFPRNSLGEIDADGHRAHHEALIRAARSQEDFWVSLKTDLAKKGLGAVILIAIGLMVTGVMAKLNLPLQ